MNKVAYKSVDELEHFRFDDCQIDTFAVTENGVELMVEALIVRADNSQNTNYTESIMMQMMCCSPRFRIMNCLLRKRQIFQKPVKGHISLR